MLWPTTRTFGAAASARDKFQKAKYMELKEQIRVGMGERERMIVPDREPEMERLLEREMERELEQSWSRAGAESKSIGVSGSDPGLRSPLLRAKSLRGGGTVGESGTPAGSATAGRWSVRSLL